MKAVFEDRTIIRILGQRLKIVNKRGEELALGFDSLTLGEYGNYV